MGHRAVVQPEMFVISCVLWIYYITGRGKPSNNSWKKDVVQPRLGRA